MANDSRFKRAIASDNKPLTIQFEGIPLLAFEGETVAATLLANGIDFTRTSAISESTRAPYCMMGTCFECLVEINHIPNRQACVELVSAGMEIRCMLGARKLSGDA